MVQAGEEDEEEETGRDGATVVVALNGSGVADGERVNSRASRDGTPS